ncbi:polysaccharide deacetylase family protein [Bythopirellula goksoeyrii]|uniref:polysaccharide deacetylase family protein n=1 Tax=Bythopirellula goksoeyrii TaxID=1400387 RepID=UPI001EE59032|nr:polysaccharide deacetylase family protein [Bythopirellula goksoeyrii]
MGIEQFQQQIHFLASSYQVLDMPEFLASRGEPRRRPAVVITFDDGYESNYLAARLLRREGLPATFFISTRIVGSERPFPHDIEKLGKRVPALSWEEASKIFEWGFHIGPHTATHANVGKINSEQAITEIRTSVEDIIAKFGRDGAAEWFAYPYGKSDDITTHLRQELEKMGVSCCLSAYGGTNPPEFSLLDIKRQGVDHKFSLLALRAIVEGWKVRTK